MEQLFTDKFASAEIEQSILGQLVVFPEMINNLTRIRESDFYFSELREIFRKLRKHFEREQKFELAVFVSELEAGEKSLLKNCMERTATIHDFYLILDRLKELSSKRRLHDKISDLFGNPDISIDTLEQIIASEKELCEGSGGAEEKALKNLDEFIDTVGQKSERVRTGFGQIDSILGGFRTPSVVHIGARPSTGKTAFALNIASNLKNKRVLIFSLEMSAAMIYERMASAENHISYVKFSDETLDEREIYKTQECARDIRSRGNLFVLDDVYNIEGIANAVMQIKPDVVIIDYIQKITTLQRVVQMREKIELISGELKRIAKFNNCVIIALSQLRRSNDKSDIIPTMSDLKESGALEADGDYIMLIHRPYVVIKNNPEITPDQTEILIDKNKFGKTGVVKLSFNGEYQRFLEIDNTRQEPREQKTNFRSYEKPPF